METHPENEIVLQELQAGDLVEFECPPLASRWAVYVGRGMVVHLTGNADDVIVGSYPGDVFTIGSQKYRKASVRKTDFLLAAAEWKAVRNNINDNNGNSNPYPSDVIVKRAESRISNDVEYGPSTQSCKHFALWCRYGEEDN